MFGHINSFGIIEGTIFGGFIHVTHTANESCCSESIYRGVFRRREPRYSALIHEVS